MRVLIDSPNTQTPSVRYMIFGYIMLGFFLRLSVLSFSFGRPTRPGANAKNGRGMDRNENEKKLGQDDFSWGDRKRQGRRRLKVPGYGRGLKTTSRMDPVIYCAPL